MKNSKEYSKEIQKLYRGLKKKGPKIKPVSYDEVLDAFVYALISESITQSQAKAAFDKFDNHFVDVNDMRVCRPEEIMEMIGDDSAETKQIAVHASTCLRTVFDTYNVLGFEDMAKMGKRQARQVLEKITEGDSFVVDYCMLTALGGHAIPLTARMIEYLKDNEMVHADSERDDIEGFLTRQISAKNAYEFYALLRKESEKQAPKKAKKKTAAKKTVKKKAAVKKTVKKKVKKAVKKVVKKTAKKKTSKKVVAKKKVKKAAKKKTKK